MSSQPVIAGFHARRTFLKGILFAAAFVALKGLTARLKGRSNNSESDTSDRGHYVYAPYIPLVARPLLIHSDFSDYGGLSGVEIFLDTPMGRLLYGEET